MNEAPSYGLWALVVINSLVFLIFAFSFTRPRSARDWRGGLAMKKVMAVVGVVAVALALGVGAAWAEGKVTITREESKPQKVEVKTGEEVRFINGSGMTTHVWFGGNDAVRFYVGKGGSNESTGHLTGGKGHSHTGTVVVK